jgi:hypothetical protein
MLYRLLSCMYVLLLLSACDEAPNKPPVPRTDGTEATNPAEAALSPQLPARPAEKP